MNDLANLIPEQHRWKLLTLLAISPYLTRAFHALTQGRGLRGVFSAIWLGTNGPGANPGLVEAARREDDKRQMPLPLDKGPVLSFACLAAAAALICTGCQLRWGKFSAAPVLPPASKIVHLRGSSIGIHVGQNPATSQPEAVIGYKSFVLDTVPTSTNTVYAPAVRSTVGVDGRLTSPGITESLEVGDAAKPVLATNAVPLLNRLTQ